MQGLECSECKPGFFNLEESNNIGCECKSLVYLKVFNHMVKAFEKKKLKNVKSY